MASADTLAKAIYYARSQAFGVPADLAFDDLPVHLRSGLVEVATRLLLTLAPGPTPLQDAFAQQIYAYANELAQQAVNQAKRRPLRAHATEPRFR